MAARLADPQMATVITAVTTATVGDMAAASMVEAATVVPTEVEVATAEVAGIDRYGARVTTPG